MAGTTDIQFSIDTDKYLRRLQTVFISFLLLRIEALLSARTEKGE